MSNLNPHRIVFVPLALLVAVILVLALCRPASADGGGSPIGVKVNGPTQLRPNTQYILTVTVTNNTAHDQKVEGELTYQGPAMGQSWGPAHMTVYTPDGIIPDYWRQSAPEWAPYFTDGHSVANQFHKSMWGGILPANSQLDIWLPSTSATINGTFPDFFVGFVRFPALEYTERFTRAITLTNTPEPSLATSNPVVTSFSSQFNQAHIVGERLYPPGWSPGAMSVDLYQQHTHKLFRSYKGPGGFSGGTNQELSFRTGIVPPNFSGILVFRNSVGRSLPYVFTSPPAQCPTRVEQLASLTGTNTDDWVSIGPGYWGFGWDKDLPQKPVFVPFFGQFYHSEGTPIPRLGDWQPFQRGRFVCEQP